jgi:hypothetical protein
MSLEPEKSLISPISFSDENGFWMKISLEPEKSLISPISFSDENDF